MTSCSAIKNINKYKQIKSRRKDMHRGDTDINY